MDDFKQYVEIEAVNWSSLKHMKRSPMHYAHALKAANVDTVARAQARASHTAVLEAERFLLDYVVFKGKTRRGKAWDAFKGENSDKTIVKRVEVENAIAIRKSIMAYEPAKRLLASGVAEQTLRWIDPATGIPCKGRPDFVNYDLRAIVDLKTTNDIDARSFARQAAQLLYHFQLAFYRRGLEVITGKTFDPKIIAVESNAPHDRAVFPVDEDALQSADMEIDGLLARVAECRASGVWPGRYPDEETLYLPSWALNLDGTEALTVTVLE